MWLDSLGRVAVTENAEKRVELSSEPSGSFEEREAADAVHQHELGVGESVLSVTD